MAQKAPSNLKREAPPETAKERPNAQQTRRAYGAGVFRGLLLMIPLGVLLWVLLVLLAYGIYSILAR